MPDELTISISSESLDSGSAEEQATFGMFVMAANGRPLTAGMDAAGDALKLGPYVSGYPFAEWLAWNWWRLRWELGRPAVESVLRRWDFAHRMSTVGEGYAWPDIAIFSDGRQSFLVSEPSPNLDSSMFRYIGASRRKAVSSESLEAAIDEFVGGVLTRLDRRELRRTNLHRLWSDLTAERENPELVRFRRLEAQLGYDPDEAGEDDILGRLNDAGAIGEEALAEVAADEAAHGGAISAKNIRDIAERSGFDAKPNDAVALSNPAGAPRPGEIQAWRVGQRLARDIRNQEGLNGQALPDKRLAEFAGTQAGAISKKDVRSEGISFAFDRDGGRSRISLRSKWKTGRRFELARLIGDRIFGNQIAGCVEPLYPATRTYSYRQKVQRAFAAELLSPFESVNGMLDGDCSEEKQNEIAEHFRVSPLTIRTQLVNHRRIGDAPDVVDRGPAASFG